MKHKYSKLAISLYYLAVAVVLVILVVILTLIRGDISGYYVGFVLIYFYTIALDYKYRAPRSVEFFDKYMHLTSIHIKEKKNWCSFSICYEDIYSIESKKLPILGIWNIVLKANNFYKINLSFCFCKHTDMFITICERAKNANPNVSIDDNLRLFLERNQK